MRSEFPWHGLLQLAGLQLRLPLSEFWRMTPPELLSLLRDRGDQPGGRPLSRQEFDTLKEAYPDSVIQQPG